MEVFWFAVCTILALISAEEKLLYQTPNGNRWGGWESTTDGWHSVIKLVFCCFCFTQYLDYKHLICQSLRVAFLWCSGCITVDPPSLSKDTFVRRAHFLKYNLRIFSARISVLFYTHLNLLFAFSRHHTIVVR